MGNDQNKNWNQETNKPAPKTEPGIGKNTDNTRNNHSEESVRPATPPTVGKR